MIAKVLIVDDHALVRHALRNLIEASSDLQLCGAADGTEAAREMLDRDTPDLVVLDLGMDNSRTQGLRLIDEIRQRCPATRILISSMQDEAVFAERSLQAGASGFVSKAEPVECVVEAIREVLKGNTYLSERARNAIDGDDEENDGGCRLRHLSPRELEIFELVGLGQSPHEIADRLHIGIKTVDAHRQNIRRKLGLANMGDLIRQAAVWMAEAN